MTAIEQASKEEQLINLGWNVKHEFWSHPKRVYNGLPYLFTFEDACKVEGI